MVADKSDSLTFGPFEIDLEARVLRAGGEVVELSEAPMRLLATLVERPGELVSSDELRDQVWPGEGGDDASLRATISELRRVLGGAATGQYIGTVHGRGYRFVWPPGEDEAHPLPQSLIELVGREADIEALSGLLGDSRLVTIVGSGGLGKSTLALAAAGALRRRFPGGTPFVDLALLSTGSSVAGFVGATLGVEGADAVGPLAEALRGRNQLIVIDNCEHLLAEVAPLVEQVLQAAPDIRILATSREALRALGETVFRLTPLAAPAPGQLMTPAEAAAFPAIRLFLQRVCASLPGFALDDKNAGVVAELCRRLDGMPLALELAAGWVEPLGLDQLLRQLDTHFLLEADGARSAMPRHRTLSAMMEWSVDALAPVERDILYRLGTLRGGFSRSAALAVVCDGTIGEDAALQGLSALVAKSLVSVEFDRGRPRFRLLETTRMFSVSRLSDHPEAQAVYARHAAHTLAAMEAASGELLTLNRREWFERYADLLADVISAFEWAFGPSGDALLGARLATATSTHATLLPNYQQYLRRAEEALRKKGDGGPAPSPCGPPPPPPKLIVGSIHPDMSVAYGFVTDDEADREARTAYAEWTQLFSLGQYHQLWPLVQRFTAAAPHTGIAEFPWIARRIGAQTAHFLGDHQLGKALALETLEAPYANLPLTSVSHHVSMRLVLARIAFLEGDARMQDYLAEADRLAEADGDLPVAQMIALAALPIAIWSGDRDVTRARLRRLSEVSAAPALAYWGNWSRDVEIALSLIDQPLDAWRGPLGPVPIPTGNALLLDLLPTFHPRLVSGPAVERARSRQQGWSAAEVLHAAAVMGRDDERRNELEASLALAEAQGERAWVERIARSIAELGRQPP